MIYVSHPRCQVLLAIELRLHSGLIAGLPHVFIGDSRGWTGHAFCHALLCVHTPCQEHSSGLEIRFLNVILSLCGHG